MSDDRPVDPADYEARVTAMADALHEDCRLKWQAIRVVDPSRQVTQHGPDAHYGQAHDLVRRLAASPTLLARRAPGDRDRAEWIETAAKRVMKLLEPLDRQAADGGGPRHMVEVTAETWRYNATPMIGDLRRALAADSRPEQREPLDVERLARAVRQVWADGHHDLRSGLTTDPEDATLATAIAKVYPDA